MGAGSTYGYRYSFRYRDISALLPAYLSGLSAYPHIPHPTLAALAVNEWEIDNPDSDNTAGTGSDVSATRKTVTPKGGFCMVRMLGLHLVTAVIPKIAHHLNLLCGASKSSFLNLQPPPITVEAGFA